MATNQNIYNVNYGLVEANLTPPNHRTPKWLAWLNVLLYPLQWLHNNFFGDYANGSNYPFYNATNAYTVGTTVIDIDNAVYRLTLGSNYINGSIIISGGSNYTNPAITLNGGGGTGGQVTPVITGGIITGLNLINCGYGYTSAPTASITDPTGSGANIIITTTTKAPVPHLNVSNGIWALINPDYRGVRPQTNFNGTKLVLEGILNQFFRTTFRQPNNPQLPDIYIQNNKLSNNVFVIAQSESEASAAVELEFDALNYVVYGNSDYNFDGNDFTIFVPALLYWAFCGATSIAGVGVTSGGKYSSAVVEAVSFSGGGGSGAVGTTVMGPITGGFTILSVTMSNHGGNYTSQPTVVVAGGSPPPVLYAIPANTTEGDNHIKNIAGRYVIAGMTYNIQPY